MRPFIINFKNYSEVAGEKAEGLSIAAKRVSDKLDIEIVLAPPQPTIAAIARISKLPVFCQHLDNARAGQTTGFFVPEMAKSFGASGSIINHSEHRLDLPTIVELVGRLRTLKMISVVCARTPTEVEQYGNLNPDFVAIEPPELIGSGKAVSQEDPDIITRSVQSLHGSANIVCGAGISQRDDVVKAIELGSKGVLVASSIVKASSWYDKIYELGSGMV